MAMRSPRRTGIFLPVIASGGPQEHMSSRDIPPRGLGMAHYLVSAVPRTARLDELEDRLARDEFIAMQPFGRALTKSLRGAIAQGRGGCMGRRGTIAALPLPRNAPPSSIAILMTSRSSLCVKARAGAVSVICRGFFPTCP